MTTLWCIVWIGACTPTSTEETSRASTADSTLTGPTDTWLERRPPAECNPSTEAFVSTRLAHPAEPEHRFAGGGIAALDGNGDGVLDLLTTGSQGVRLLLGPTYGTDHPMPAVDGPVTGATVADLDGDGLDEVFLSLHGPPDLLLRQIDGAWQVDQTAVFPAGHSQSAAVVDLDRDGHLDLLVAGHGIPAVVDDQVTIEAPGTPTRVYMGRPGGGFDDHTDALPRAFRDAYTFVVAPIDLDGDGRDDLYTANDYPNWIPQQAALAVDGGWVEADPTLGLSPQGAGMGLGIGDLNDDGIDDLLLPVWNKLFLLTSVPGVGWVQTAQRDGLVLPERDGAWVGWGGELQDLDHDGLLDVVAAFGHLDTLAGATVGGGDASNLDDQPILAWLQREGRFVPVDMNLPTDGAHRGFVLHDLDGDGGLDLAAPRLDGGIDWLQSTCRDGAWLTVALDDRGTAGLGAQVQLTASGRTVRRTVRAGGTSLLSSWPAVVHFGLGQATDVSVEVRWPDGLVESLGTVDTRQHVIVHRGDEGG